MKFSVDSKTVAKPLNACARICKSKHNNPVYSMIKVTAKKPDLLKFEATDGAIHIEYYCRADVDEDGMHLVDGRRFAKFVSARASRTRVHTTKVRMIVNNAGGKLWLNFFAGSTLFPEFPQIPVTPPATLSGGTVKDLMSIAFMAEDEGDLDGIYTAVSNGVIETLATNKARVGYAWSNIDWDGKQQFIIPRYVAESLPWLMFNDDDIKVHLTGNKIMFMADDFVFSSLGKMHPFPYDALKKLLNFPVNQEMTVDVEELLDVLDMASFVVDESKAKLQRIYFDSDGLANTLDISTPEGSEIGGVDYRMVVSNHTGEDFHFILAPTYIDDLIRALERLKKGGLYDIGDLKSTVTIGRGSESKLVYFYATGMTAKFAMAPIEPKS